MVRLLKILFILVLLLTLTAAYLLFTPLDLTDYKNYLVNYIESATNTKVSMQKIVLRVLPNPRILMEGFEIKDGEEVIFSSKSVRMHLELIPLIKREIDVTRVTMESPTLRIRRDKSGNFNIANLLGKSGAGTEIKEAKIKNGSVVFTDDFVGDNVSFSMDSITASFRPDYKLNKTTYTINGDLRGKSGALGARVVSVSLNGESRNFGTDDFVIEGKIQAGNLAVQDYMPYIKGAYADIEFNGIVGLSAAYSVSSTGIEANGMVDYNSLDADLPKLFQKRLVSGSGKANVNLSYNDKTSLIGITNGVFHLPEFTLKGNIAIEGFRKDSVTAELDITTSPIPLKTVKTYIPYNILTPSVSQKLDKTETVSGSLTITNLKYSSKNPDTFSTEMQIKNGSFKFSDLKRQFSDTSGNVSFTRRTLKFENVRGKYGKNIIEHLDGSITDLDTKPFAGWKGTFNIDLRDIMDDLKIWQSGKAWSKNLDGLKDVSGAAYTTLEVSGNLEDKDIFTYKGTTALKSLNLAYKDLLFPIKDMNGTLNFDNQKITLNNLAGKWEKSDFTSSGTISDYTENPKFNLNIKGFVTEVSAREILADLKDTDIHFDNRLQFSLNLNGDENNFFASISLDTTKSNITYSTLAKKPSNYPLFIDSNMQVKKHPEKPDSVKNIDRLNIRFGRASIDIKGSLNKDKRVFSIKGENISMDDLDNITNYFKSEFKSSGIVSAQLKVVQELKNNRKQVDGEIKIKDAEFETTMLPQKVTKANITLKLSGSSINIVIDNLETGTTKLSGKINIPDISNKYFLNFNIVSQYLDPADLYVSERGDSEPVITGSGRITVQDGKFIKLEIKSFSTDVLMSPETIVLKPLSFINNNGIVSGDFTYYRAKDKPLLFAANLKINGCEMEPLINGLGAKEKVLTGKFNVDFELTAKKGKEKITEGINGHGNVESKNGKLWRFVVMSKIFSIVNIISIDNLLREGLPYNQLKGSFVIKDGILSSEDLALYSPSMRMSAIGNIDMGKSTVDAKLGIHPFVTIDSIISKIPIAGWIIGGKEKSTISMYYEIKGPLNNPDVEAVPVKSIGLGILGIFQRILETPVEIIKPLVR